MSPFLALCLCLCCRPEHSDLSPATLMENHIPTTFKGKAPSGLVCKPPQIRGHQRCDSTSSCSYIQKTLFSRDRASPISSGYPGTHPARPGWPRTQKSARLCLQSAGIKGVRHHTRLILSNQGFLYYIPKSTSNDTHVAI